MAVARILERLLMFHQVWQASMIWLARSPRAKAFMQNGRAGSFLAGKYVAGQTAEAGVSRAAQLFQDHGIRASLFLMGEYVDSWARVDHAVAGKSQAAGLLAAGGWDVHISVDPTQIGHHIDPTQVEGHARRILGALTAAALPVGGVHGLMFDMEDASLNDPTIALHDRLQAQGLPVMLTLQAYLRRTEADLAAQIARGSRVRLVKGAFAAGRDIAFGTRAEIKANHRRLIAMMLSPTARAAGFYPIIATHDTALHDYARGLARSNGWPVGSYEFEMLLGVREDVAIALAQMGERVRLYVPFGQDWWPHAVRRIGENPANAVLLARSLVG